MQQSDNFNLNDIELWARASQGDALAEEQLVTKYSILVRICARPYFLAGADSEDLIQEGMIGLISAIRHFDVQRNTQFKTYAEICIRRRMYDAIKSASGLRHIPLNDYIPLESTQLEERLTPATFYLSDPEDMLIARERVDEMWAELRRMLSRFESQILDMFLEGMSYDEMAHRIGKSVKSVDNAVQRIRKKLAQYINKGDHSVD